MAQAKAKQELVNAVVQDVITEHGREAAIPLLLQAVHSMAEISLADPENKAKERQYRQWMKAVKAVCRAPKTFEQQINPADMSFARQMGIALT